MVQGSNAMLAADGRLTLLQGVKQLLAHGNDAVCHALELNLQLGVNASFRSG